jgi:hypothetical protein
VEEAASKADELAQLVVLVHCYLIAKTVAPAAVKSEHSVPGCTAAGVAQRPQV